MRTARYEADRETFNRDGGMSEVVAGVFDQESGRLFRERLLSLAPHEPRISMARGVDGLLYKGVVVGHGKARE